MKTCYILELILTILLTYNVWPESFQFVSIAELPEQIVAAPIIEEIFERAGHTIHITPLPAKRAQFESSSGKSDGEILRVFSFGEENPPLIRVPTPYSSVEITAFAREGRDDIAIDSQEDILNYSIVILRGAQILIDLTEGHDKIFY